MGYFRVINEPVKRMKHRIQGDRAKNEEHSNNEKFSQASDGMNNQSHIAFPDTPRLAIEKTT